MARQIIYKAEKLPSEISGRPVKCDEPIREYVAETLRQASGGTRITSVRFVGSTKLRGGYSINHRYVAHCMARDYTTPRSFKSLGWWLVTL